MKNRLFIFLVSFLTIFAYSCKNEDPVACFVIPERLEMNEEYKFKDCSIDVQSYYWDFGDGQYSELPEPVHIFGEERNYTISLRVKGKKKKDELKRTVAVWLNDLTGASDGYYSGQYNEYYADSIELNKEYSASLSISAINTKEIKVAFSRGSFKAAVSGDMETGYTFSSATQLEPARLDLITSASGTFTKKDNSFTMTLSGRDPQVGNLRWKIVYVGAK